MLMQNFLGGGGANNVHYGKCGSGIRGAKSTFWGGGGFGVFFLKQVKLFL